jgi:DNA modification methylase
MATKRSTTEEAQAAIKAAQETAAEWVELDRLHGWAKNPKRHPDAQVRDLMRSIKRFGWGAVILARPNGEVIAGHGRLEAAKRLGMERVPVRWLNLDPGEAHLLALADNKLTEVGEWDDALVREILEGAKQEGADITGLGWSEDELSEVLAGGGGTEGLTDPDETPEVQESATTKPGDLWILGKHRLLCGDSTKNEDVSRLMAGEKADLCFTSPPYALGKSVALSGNKSMSSRQNAYDSHDDSSDGWESLMRKWFIASLGAVSHVWIVNVQPLAGNKRALVRWIADNADRLIDIVTWDKGHAAPQMAQGVMASRYEWMILLGEVGASRSVPLSSWRGTIQSVYEAPPQRSNDFSEIHAATMPTHVPSWVMGELCNQSKTIFEPFCGTGTTIIAAEKLGRRCFGMEISPQYCDVIVRRWQEFTGQQATLESDGHTFTEVSAVRRGA